MDTVAEMTDLVGGPGAYAFISIIVLGFVIGFIAFYIRGSGGLGMVWSLILGMVGSVAGAMLFSFLGLSYLGLVGQLVLGMVGACVLLYVARLAYRSRHPVSNQVSHHA